MVVLSKDLGRRRPAGGSRTTGSIRPPVNTRRLLELGKVEPGREHTHALPAA